MASITARKNRKRTVYDVWVVLPNGERGKISAIPTKSAAEIYASKLESLIKMKKFGFTDFPVLAWLEELKTQAPIFYDRLVDWGLADKRVVIGTLQDLVNQSLQNTELKPRTLYLYRLYGKRVTDFFGTDRKVDTITETEAEEWFKCAKSKYAEGTLHRTVVGAKFLFRLAIKNGWITKSPFAVLKNYPSIVNKSKMFFVSEEISRALLEELNSRDRLIFALARYGGLRVLSELWFMDWEDIQFDKNFFIVKIPKKTHKEQQKRGEFTQRRVPLFPELKKYFLEYWESLPEGAGGRVFLAKDIKHSEVIRRRFHRALKRIGIEPWPKLFQNCRSTRETELADAFPIQDVTEWIGNTPEVARKHYLQARFEMLERAAQFTATAPPKSEKEKILELAKGLKVSDLLELIEALKEQVKNERITI